MARHLEKSSALSIEATRYLAGGVSSDARRTTGVPLYVDCAQGSHLWDVDGNEYIDYVLGQGPSILGHSAKPVVDAVVEQAARGMVYSAQHEAEVEVARLLCQMVPCADLVRFNSVGSEAVHAALRVARGATGRAKVLKFEGHYHGWFDPVLYSVHPALDVAGPSDRPHLVPGTLGQAPGSAADMVVAPWNDVESLARVLAENRGQVAAIIMEPVLCNSGAIMPEPGYLETVQAMAKDHGSLVIFDEVITGFRLARGGAQEYLGITPDLAVLGKAMAGGMQVSAVAGRTEVMEHVASGKIGHAGTFNSHPVAVAAALATLTYLNNNADAVYRQLFRSGHRLMAGLRGAAQSLGMPLLVDGPGPVFQTYFTQAVRVRDYRDFKRSDFALAARFQQLLLDRGVNIVARGLWFLSTAHTDRDIDQTVAAAHDALSAL